MTHFPTVGKWRCTEHDPSGCCIRDWDVPGDGCHERILARTRFPQARHDHSSGSFSGVKAAVDGTDLAAMLAAGESGGE